VDLHDIAATLIAPAVAVPALRLRWGVVSTVAGDGTLSINIGGSDTAVSGFVAIDQVTAVAKDTVVLITDGVDMLVIGTVGA